MRKAKHTSITVQGTTIRILPKVDGDYVSLTDMVQNFDGSNALIEQWLRNKDTVLFLGIWERINNPDFNSLEFEGIRNQAGRNSFFLSAKKWIDLTRANGLIARAGRYGGTYAHKDIAFEFGSWLSPEFKLYLIKEFQRLKDEESDRLKLDWNLQRTLSKINYRIHTDAIKDTLIPPMVTQAQAGATYASEADVLNIALFGQTARQWRRDHPNADGNIRDHATLEQLVILTNLESLNAVLIRQGLPIQQRLLQLNQIAIAQMQTLLGDAGVRNLKT
ncbi:MAG: KilA-N domain-containing protein [Candidatus Kapabacteria bacterium]|nr:KilA-N domain-containing protein [Candidatus Kapabacteria bacterium]